MKLELLIIFTEGNAKLKWKRDNKQIEEFEINTADLQHAVCAVRSLAHVY